MAIDRRAKDIAPRVRYERERLLASAVLLFREDPCLTTRSDWPYFNDALLESFLAGVRAMRDFLHKDGSKYPDDVFATHFFDNVTDWTSKRPPVGAYLSANKERLDKAMAHLSYERITYEASGKDWDVRVMVTELETVWNAFWSALPPERQAWFTETQH